MARIPNKEELVDKIIAIEELTKEEKTALIGLLRENKRYGIVWEDKPENVELAMQDHIPTLKEVKDRAIISDAHDAPNHIIIEGDNLQALLPLTYTHEGKIDVIYIDPPYNTGKKDFIYNDAFVDEDNEYRHSKWLSFMSKRLIIAKQLLSEKGVIFISIDDNEQAQLKMLCDEVFDRKSFVGQLVIKTATDNNATQINTEHEYMLCYCINLENQNNWKRLSEAAKSIIEKYNEFKLDGLSIGDIQKELRKWIKKNKENLKQVEHYNNVDEKGVYSSSSNSSNPHPGDYNYDIFHPITKLPCPKPQNGWRWPKDTFEAYDAIGEVAWGKDETTQPHIKKRIETAMDFLRTLIYEDNRGTTKALSDMFEGKKVFDNPKPLKVLNRILDFTTDTTSTILDFFAGSGTTLHATMQLNAEDGGKRQCILVTNNENGICENVTYERNKRVIEGYTTPKGDNVEGLNDNNLRYYKVDMSVPRDATPQSMRQLMAASTDMLCIKNGVYDEQATFCGKKLKAEYVRYFANDDCQMLIVYDERMIEHLVPLIKANEFASKLKVYVYSPSFDPFTQEWEEVADKVELCAMPQAIYDVYRRLLKPKASVQIADEESVEPENAEEQ